MAEETLEAPADMADASPDDDEPTSESSTPGNPDTDKWKGLARKHERESKTLLAKLKEYEDRDKSDLDKLTEKLSAAEKRALDADRLEIALEKGLTKSQAKRLVGATREELEADADELLADLGVTNETDEEEDEKPSPPRRPRERLRPGAAPDAEPEENDPVKLAEAVQKAKYGF